MAERESTNRSCTLIRRIDSPHLHPVADARNARQIRLLPDAHPNPSRGTGRGSDIRPVVAAIRLQARPGRGDALVAVAEGRA